MSLNKIVKLASYFNSKYLVKQAILTNSLSTDVDPESFQDFKELIRIYQDAHSIFPKLNTYTPVDTSSVDIQDPYQTTTKKKDPTKLDPAFRYAINQVKIHLLATNASDNCIYNHLVKLEKLKLLSDRNYNTRYPFKRTVNPKPQITAEPYEEDLGVEQPIPVKCQ